MNPILKTNPIDFEAEILDNGDWNPVIYQAVIGYTNHKAIPGDSINPPEPAFKEILFIKWYSDGQRIDYKPSEEEETYLDDKLNDRI